TIEAQPDLRSTAVLASAATALATSWRSVDLHLAHPHTRPRPVSTVSSDVTAELGHPGLEAAEQLGGGALDVLLLPARARLRLGVHRHDVDGQAGTAGQGAQLVDLVPEGGPAAGGVVAHGRLDI